MKKRLIYVITIVLLSTGCGGPYYYDLHTESSTGNDQIKIDKILFVDEIRSGEPYWSQNIVFRKDPYRIEYYTFRQWAKRPGELVRDAAVFFYRKSSTFRKVIGEYSSIEPDLSMKIHIYSFEMLKLNKDWYARLAMDIEVIEYGSEKVLLAASIDRKEKIKKKDPRYLSEKISLILGEELLKVSETLKNLINRG